MWKEIKVKIGRDGRASPSVSLVPSSQASGPFRWHDGWPGDALCGEYSGFDIVPDTQTQAEDELDIKDLEMRLREWAIDVMRRHCGNSGCVANRGDGRDGRLLDELCLEGLGFKHWKKECHYEDREYGPYTRVEDRYSIQVGPYDITVHLPTCPLSLGLIVVNGPDTVDERWTPGNRNTLYWLMALCKEKSGLPLSQEDKAARLGMPVPDKSVEVKLGDEKCGTEEQPTAT